VHFPAEAAMRVSSIKRKFSRSLCLLLGFATPLGAVQSLTLESTGHRGGMVYRNYQVKFAQKTVNLSIYAMPDGKIERHEVIVPN
jgi:hypothetical protein